MVCYNLPGLPFPVCNRISGSTTNLMGTMHLHTSTGVRMGQSQVPRNEPTYCYGRSVTEVIPAYLVRLITFFKGRKYLAPPTLPLGETKK